MAGAWSCSGLSPQRSKSTSDRSPVSRLGDSRGLRQRSRKDDQFPFLHGLAPHDEGRRSFNMGSLSVSSGTHRRHGPDFPGFVYADATDRKTKLALNYQGRL